MSKKILSITLVLALLLAIVPAGRIEVQASQPWQTAYAEYLRALIRNPGIDRWGETQDWRFLLHDIDNNNIPELIVFSVDATHIYSFAGGRMIELDFDGWFGGFFAQFGIRFMIPPSNTPGIIVEEGDDFGVSATRYVIEGNRLVAVESSQRLDGEQILINELTESNIQSIIFGWGSWQQAYTQILQNLPHTNSMGNVLTWYFEVIDIDRDGIPELLVSSKWYYELTNTFTIEAWHDTTYFYTFRSGLAVRLESNHNFAPAGSGWLFYLPNDNQSGIFAGVGHYSGYGLRRYSIEGNTLVDNGVHGEVFHSQDTGESNSWRINERNVTELEFNQVFGGVPILRENIVNEANIQRLIYRWQPQTQPTPPTQTTQTWQEAYAAILRNSTAFTQEHGFGANAFTLYDFGNNGVPQIIIEADASGNTGRPFLIYTFANNTTTLLDELWGWDFEISNNREFSGVFVSSGVNRQTEISYLELLNGMFRSTHIADVDFQNNTTTIVTQGRIADEWTRVRANQNASSLLDFHSITEANIQRHIFNWQPQVQTSPQTQPSTRPNTGIAVTLDGRYIQFDTPPVSVDGRTLVPVREIFEAMGARINWEPNTQTVTAVRGNTTVTLRIGSNVLNRNGQNITLDVPARIINGRTFVPARAVAEAFGANVEWDATTQTVILTSN